MSFILYLNHVTNLWVLYKFFLNITNLLCRKVAHWLQKSNSHTLNWLYHFCYLIYDTKTFIWYNRFGFILIKDLFILLYGWSIFDLCVQQENISTRLQLPSIVFLSQNSVLKQCLYICRTRIFFLLTHKWNFMNLFSFRKFIPHLQLLFACIY